jgi:hypothetical protein
MKVTKWSTFTGDLTVSEQKGEQTSREPGSLEAGPAVPVSTDAPSQSTAASVPEIAGVDSHKIAPDHEAPKADTPKVEAPRVEAPKVEASKPHTSGTDPRLTGKLVIMSSGDRSSNDDGAHPKAGTASGKRRFSAMAAVVALATVAGAIGGALATSALTRPSAGAETAGNAALEAAVARIDADITALKASVEQTSKMAVSQFNKTGDRLDKVEKAQAEPAAKLAKLSEAVDKLRAAPVPAPMPVAAVPAAPKEVTGSIAPPASTAAATPPKVEVARLPKVEGWILRDVGNGGALIESRQGIFEVYAGDPVPGLGRIDAIRKQDGRWVVVTSKGLIVAR